MFLCMSSRKVKKDSDIVIVLDNFCLWYFIKKEKNFRYDLLFDENSVKNPSRPYNNSKFTSLLRSFRRNKTLVTYLILLKTVGLNIILGNIKDFLCTCKFLPSHSILSTQYIVLDGRR